MNEQILASAVVEQAVADWRWAISPTPVKHGWKERVRSKVIRLRELRRFFRQSSADVFSGGNAKLIIARLEEEYARSAGRAQIEAYERGEID